MFIASTNSTLKIAKEINIFIIKRIMLHTFTATYQWRLNFVTAGTNFCSPGQIARTYAGLGRYKGTDRCCRTHDQFCTFRIRGFEKKYGLKNSSYKASSHCHCETKFIECLFKVGTKSNACHLHLQIDEKLLLCLFIFKTALK